jgi:probable phosphoglycerate mutase
MSSDEAVDPGLTVRGADQAQRLAAALGEGAYGPVTAIVASTMRRAQETAKPCADVLGLPVTGDDRLVELDAGATTYGSAFTGYTTRAQAFEALNEGRFGSHLFDVAAFVKRSVEAIEDAAPRGRGENVLVVCHGGVISAYLAHIVGASRPLFVSPDHTGVTRVLVTRDGYREVLSLNECHHLQETPVV